MHIKHQLTILFLSVAICATAQRTVPADTTIKSTTIEIIQSYKPQVKQAPKPGWMPALPPADTARPVITYDVPQQSLFYTYSSLPLRPLALGRDTILLPFKNYLKFGGGNLSTIYVDAGIGSFRGRDYETGLHLHHISQNGTVKDQQTSLSGLEAYAGMHKNKNDFHVLLTGGRNQYSYYGGDANPYYAGDSMKQVFTNVKLMFDLSNRKDTSTKLTYHPSISASYYNAKYNANELSMGFNAPFAYSPDSTFDWLLGLDGVITNFKSEQLSASNNFLEIKPGIALHDGAIAGHVMAGFALGKGNSKYILPDLLGSYFHAQTGLYFSAGWLATVRQNTFEQLSTLNPFIYYLDSSNFFRQTRRDEVFAQVQGKRGDHLSFSARASWNAYIDMATYLNDGISNKQFYVGYQNINSLGVSLSIRYAESNIWSAGVSCDIYDYYGSSNVKVYAWQIPDKQIKGDIIYSPTNKLSMSAYLSLIGGLHARNAMGQPISIDLNTDVGGNIEYLLIPRLSIFLQVNNILNQKYQRWYGYEAYGTNIYGGLRLKF